MRTERLAPRPLIRGLAGAAAMALLPLAGPGAAAAQAAPPAVAAPAPGSTAEDVQSLRERAATFWAARVALDATRQWELLEPRGRGRMTAEEYGGVPRAVKYLGYQVEGASVRGYFAKVKVRLIVQPVLPSAPHRQVAPTAVVVDDTWVRIGGTWYRALEQEDGRPPAETRG